jgi:hypothetical protein
MYGSSLSTRSGKSNAWQKRVDRRKLAKEKAAAEAGAGPITPAKEEAETSDTVSTHAKAILERMESVNALITSLKGRTDEYSVNVRNQLHADLAKLRLQRTQLKPLEDQTSILEALVEKKSAQLMQAERDVQEAIATMEQTKASLMVVQEQLTGVRVAKAKEDQAIKEQQEEQKLPDNRMAVTKMKDLLCLLPAEKAGGFNEMLNLLEGIFSEAATPSLPIIHPVDSDSEMGAASEMPASASGTLPEIPTFPSAAAAVAAHVDPYGDGGDGASTPRRRTRSESPRRSPGARSRSNEHRRLCPVSSSFSRRELGGPFTG